MLDPRNQSKTVSVDDLITSDVGYQTEISTTTETQVQNMVGFLADQYNKNVPKQVKEYVTNEQDVHATNIHVVVDNGDDGYVLIAGNGDGMSLPEDQVEFAKMSVEELTAYTKKYFREYFEEHGTKAPDFIPETCILRLPYRIADSHKDGKEGQVGDKGIGALNWQGLGESVIFYSKRENEDPVAWVASGYANENNKLRFDSKVIDSRSEIGQEKLAWMKEEIERELGIEGYLESHGTAVMIKKLRKGQIKQSQGKRVSDKIGSSLSQWIREGNHAFVAEKTNAIRTPEWIEVEPNMYESFRSLFNETIQTDHGPIKVELYFTNRKSNIKGEKPKVKVYNQGAEFIDDLHLEKETLQTDVYGSGFVIGEISTDFLESNTGRTGFGIGTTNVTFFETLIEYVNDIVKERVDDFKRKSSTAQLKRHKDTVMSVVEDIFTSENDLYSDMYFGGNITSDDNDHKGDFPEADFADKVEPVKKKTPPRLLPTRPYKPRKKRKPKTGDGKAVKPGNKNIGQRRGNSMGLSIEDEDNILEFRDLGVLGLYEPDTNQMYINENSPAYGEAVELGFVEEYMLRIIASETANFLYAPDDHPRFRQIELEQAFLGSLSTKKR